MFMLTQNCDHDVSCCVVGNAVHCFLGLFSFCMLKISKKIYQLVSIKKERNFRSSFFLLLLNGIGCNPWPLGLCIKTC